MAIGQVTAPPVLIDSGTGLFHQDYPNLQGSAFQGSSQATNQFSIGGTLFFFGYENVNTSHCRCFTSTNKGLTWTPQDTVHEPGFDGNFLSHDPKIFYPGFGNLIYVVWDIQLAHRFFLVNTFNILTLKWGVQSAQGPQDIVSTFYVQLAALSNGDVYVFFTGLSSQVVFLKLSAAGVWSAAPTAITSAQANVTGRIKSMFMISNIVHLFYQETNSVTNLANLKYIQVNAGVPGTPVTIFTGSVANAVWNTGAGAVWNNQLVVPFQNTNDNITKVIFGSPISNPVFTTATVDPAASTVPAGNNALMPSAMVDRNNVLNVFWGTNSTGDLDDRVWTSVNAGAGFSVPAVFYSDATNPPPGEATPGIVAISSPVQGSLFFLWDATTAAGTPTFSLAAAPTSSFYSFHIYLKGVKRMKNEDCKP